MSYDDTAAALFTAVEPVAAYCQRTARPNRHADQLDQLLSAVADFGAAADQAVALAEAGPDWEAIAMRLAPLLPPVAPTPLEIRCRAFLDSPAMKARAALPLAQRMALASITSHHLGTPDTF